MRAAEREPFREPSAFRLPPSAFPYRHHHPAITAAFVVLFWGIAAVLVVAARGGDVVTVAALLAVACAYTRLVAREAGVTHALGVGITWLLLSIVTEIAITTQIGHSWFSLLGSPDRPLLRNLLLFGWIFSPALFARREVST